MPYPKRWRFKLSLLAVATLVLSLALPAASAMATDANGTGAGPGNFAPDARERTMALSMNIPLWNTFLATDLNDEAAAFEVLQLPANGTFEIVSEVRHIGRASWQWFKYTPASNFTGTDIIRYRATDPAGASDEASVKIEVGAGEWSYKIYDVAATPPPGTYAEPVHVELSVPSIDPEWAEYYGQPAVRYTTDGSDPICNDGTPSSTTRSVHLATSTTIRATACYAYGYSSPIGEFAYTIEDPSDRNQPPYAFPRYIAMVKNVPLGNNLLGRDRDSEPLTFEILDNVDNGVLTLAGQATSTHWLSWVWAQYRPDVNFVGQDELRYRVTDPHGATATATAVFDVQDRPYAYHVAPVSASPEPGMYSEPQMVSLTMNTSTTMWGETSIWYTKDGSTPACGVGNVYSSPLSIPVDVTIRAIACYHYGYSSEVTDFVYTFGKPKVSSGAPLPLPSFGNAAPVFVPPVPQVVATAVAPRVLGESSCTPAATPAAKVDAKLARRLGGRILRATESCGEIWYVGPNTGKRYKLPTDPSQFVGIRGLVLKVSDAQLTRIAIGTQVSDQPKVWVPASFRGRFLQATDGSLWYVNPLDGRRYVIANAADLAALSSKVGLAISNLDLAKIKVAQ